jgi:hypothetical protein
MDNNNNNNITNRRQQQQQQYQQQQQQQEKQNWPLQDDRVDGTVNRDDGRLRDTVSRAIADLRNVTIIADDSRNNNNSSNTHDQHHRALRLFVDTVGAGREEGRNTVQIDYVRQLLDTKIVVVAQRDGWEDHYR